MKKYLIIVIMILFLTGCSLYDEYKMPKKVELKINNKTFEVYSEHKIKELIKDKNIEILNENELIDTKKTGKQEIDIKYKYKLFNYKFKVKYNVLDKTKPTIITSRLEYNTNINEDIDFCSVDNIKYIDNYDRKVKCSIDGEYNISEPGTYNLKYIIKDKTGNTSLEDFTLNVIDPNEDTEYEEDDFFEEELEKVEEEGIKFSDVIKEHKDKNTIIGIDVSRWQGDIDFKKVKKAGAEFVIIRMAVSNGPKDEIGLDSYYKKNFLKAKKAGLKVGVYVYTSASSEQEIIKQAKFVKKELNKTKLDFPIVYDFESWDEIQEYKLNKYDLMNYVNKFYEIVKKDGYDVMLYGSKIYLEKVWNNKKYDEWLAHYVPNYYDKTSYEGNYKMWQICSDGLIDGINGYVDIDIYYK